MTEASVISRTRRWTGYGLSGVTTIFLLVDSVMKLIKPVFVVKATQSLGYPESTIVGIGTVLLCSTLLYVFPRTSVLGAVLLTGYLGGAVASNVRAAMPLFNVLFPIIVSSLAWTGLFLRDKRLEALLPLRSRP